MRITAARVTGLDSRFEDVTTAKVHVTTEDGVERELLDFYHDEITILPEELVGLTLEEARELKRTKDVQYLRT